MQRGSFEDRLELLFEDPSLNRHFSITRRLLAIVGVKEDYDALKARAPYVRPRRKPEMQIKEVTQGVPPPSVAEVKWVVRLLEHKAPAALLDLAFDPGSPAEIAARIRAAHLPERFNNDMYGRQFATLLWIEEERAR